MIVENKLQKVWIIKDNKLVKANKYVSKINYKGMDIAVLSTERDNKVRQELLIKDKNNEYWKMNLVEVDFEKIINAKLDPDIIECRIYSDNVVRALSQIDLKITFKKRIEERSYFNLCELAYISKNYPRLYAKAKQCRINFIEKRQKEKNRKIRSMKLQMER